MCLIFFFSFWFFFLIWSFDIALDVIWNMIKTAGQTSLECNRAGRSVGSPDELNVQWNESAGGEASTSHFSVSVSCLSAPSNSSWVVPQTGASAMKETKKLWTKWVQIEWNENARARTCTSAMQLKTSKCNIEKKT